MKKSKTFNFLIMSFAFAIILLLGGSLNEVNAQCKNDPFCKPNRGRTNTGGTTNTGGNPSTGTTPAKKPEKPAKPPVVAVAVPPIQDRIEYYKRLRETAVLNGQEIPKVTSVLTLDELSVTGIFRTPRGFAAMVEAKPIKLSYTIYPGEKFFDGQLVAIEENRLIFRKITKMSNNTFVTTVENKALRQYSDQEVVQGTAPVQAQNQPANTQPANQSSQTEIVPGNSANNNAAQNPANPATSSGAVVSPLDEMNRQREQPQPQPQNNPNNNRQNKKPKVAKKNK